MLDGDKISVLLASFLQRLVREGGLDTPLGLVQTAYANGSSTAYAQKELVRSRRSRRRLPPMRKSLL